MTDQSGLSVQKQLLARMQGVQAKHCLTVKFSECTISVRTNSWLLARGLRRYYGDFLVEDRAADMEVTALDCDPFVQDADWIIKQPDAGKTKIKEEYLDVDDGRIVRKRLTGMVFFYDRQRHLALGPCTANDNQVVNFINSRFIQWMLDRGCLLCHAAGVSLHGKGLALAGFSGMGKSTLALHMMGRGLDFVSNDRLLIRKEPDGLRMFGVAKLPRVNPGTILNNAALERVLERDDKDRYARMNPDELWSLEQKHDVFLDECFGAGRFLSASAMTGLVVLNWKRKYPRTSLEIVDLEHRPDLLATVVKSPGLFFLSGPGLSAEKGDDFSNEAYLSLLKACTVFEACGGVDFGYVSDACIHFLSRQE